MVELADHTSGLPRVVPRFTPPLTPDVMWQFVGNYRLTRPPGEQFLGLDPRFALLARAIVGRENATEDQLYARIITGPLGMRDTAIKLSSAQHARLAQGHRPNGQPAPEDAPTWPAFDGAGALRSTLNDMMTFDLQPQNSTWRYARCSPSCINHVTPPAENGSSVGLGWQMRERPDGTRTIFKDGATPGYSTFIIFTPTTASGAVILSNHRGCPVQRMGAQIIGALNEPQDKYVFIGQRRRTNPEGVSLPDFAEGSVRQETRPLVTVKSTLQAHFQLNCIIE